MNSYLFHHNDQIRDQVKKMSNAKNYGKKFL
jgi:hypothetical protein